MQNTAISVQFWHQYRAEEYKFQGTLYKVPIASICYKQQVFEALNCLEYRFSIRANPFQRVCSFRFYGVCNQNHLTLGWAFDKLYEITQLIANYDIMTFFLFLAYFQIHLLCITWFFLTLKVALCTVLEKIMHLIIWKGIFIWNGKIHKNIDYNYDSRVHRLFCI